MIDTHTHILDTQFDDDRRETILRAKEAGITRMIEIACEPQDWEPALNLASSDDLVRCALGIHPHVASKADDAIFTKLENLCAQPRVVAVGEAGLDYHYDNSPRETQKEVFIKQIELAERIKKPLIVHCREAYADALEILRGRPTESQEPKGVFHCFSGTTEQALELIGMGFFIGVDGPVTYPRSLELKKAVAGIPLEKILIETDCPYLSPVPFRGKRNEPSYITHTLKEIASLKNISVDTAAEITANNARMLFVLE